MKSEYVATEQAYKNGFAAALDEMSLCVAICHGMQRTPALACSEATKTYCGSAGDCTACRLIANSIRRERGLVEEER